MKEEKKNKGFYYTQGSAFDLPINLYKNVFPYIKNGDKLLNLGSGTIFNFEKYLSKIRNVKITSWDIYKVKKPNFIDNFINQSVEEKLNINGGFDVVTFFELIEHIDKTDNLLKNCYNALEIGGFLMFSFPNLSSLYARVELLLGFQPHVLEVSNICGNFGTGIFGKYKLPKRYISASY